MHLSSCCEVSLHHCSYSSSIIWTDQTSFVSSMMRFFENSSSSNGSWYAGRLPLLLSMETSCGQKSGLSYGGEADQPAWRLRLLGSGRISFEESLLACLGVLGCGGYQINDSSCCQCPFLDTDEALRRVFVRMADIPNIFRKGNVYP